MCQNENYRERKANQCSGDTLEGHECEGAAGQVSSGVVWGWAVPGPAAHPPCQGLSPQLSPLSISRWHQHFLVLLLPKSSSTFSQRHNVPLELVICWCLAGAHCGVSPGRALSLLCQGLGRGGCQGWVVASTHLCLVPRCTEENLIGIRANAALRLLLFKPHTEGAISNKYFRQ